MRKSAKRGRGATYASQPQEGCPLLHPLQGVSCLSTPLQGGILKPPALRVVDDLVPYQRRAQHAGQCGVEVEGGRIPTPDWMLNLQILTSGGFR